MSAKLGRYRFEFDPARVEVGASIDVLGYVVQKVSGKPLDEFVRERILEPLEMNDTGFFVPAEKQSRFAANYFSDGKGRLIVPMILPRVAICMSQAVLRRRRDGGDSERLHAAFA